MTTQPASKEVQHDCGTAPSNRPVHRGTDLCSARTLGIFLGDQMTTPELLSMMRLLSAMESAMLASKIVFPDYLSDEVTRHTEILEREILARNKP